MKKHTAHCTGNTFQMAKTLRAERQPSVHSPLRHVVEKGQPALYYQLADVFRRRIQDGVWSVGSQISTLEELIEQFGAARATVRQALTILETEGLLERHRGRGTFVLKQPEQDAIFRLGTKRMTEIGSRTTVKRELIRLEPEAAFPGPPTVKAKLAPSYGYFERLHSREGVPYVIRSGFLDSRIWKRFNEKQIGTVPLMRTIVDKFGVKLDRCEQIITVAAADFEIAKILRVQLNCPLAVVDRAVVDAEGILIMQTRGYYRGDMVRISSTLK